MINLLLDRTFDDPLRILCLGAHSDDLEIGCFATIKTLLSSYTNPEVHWMVFAASGDRAAEAKDSASRILDGAAASSVETFQFRDGFFPAEVGEIKETFESLKGRFVPDLVFTHWEQDRHQDHRVVAELTWNTFRSHLILEYEIPKYDGDLGRPNVFVPVSEEGLEEKLRHLTDHFPSQHAKHWYTSETFRGLMRIRGMEAGASSGFAEAFHCRKVTLGFGG